MVNELYEHMSALRNKRRLRYAFSQRVYLFCHFPTLKTHKNINYVLDLAELKPATEQHLRFVDSQDQAC